ncbi:MAG: hypothetical protein IJ128_02845 [Firmicutes bacterium]|nr:hypothetical protein [Bacillota bacterium]
MNLESMFRAKQEWSDFKRRHPKVPTFIDNVQSKEYCEGMEIAIAVRYPDGDQYKAGIRITKEDLETLKLIKSMR